MSTLRPLGVGSQVLTHGDKMAGFYGEVNNIITADELRNIAGVTQGVAVQTGDITWLKFSHNYKTLYIAKQPIQHSISWDHLQEKDLVFGKMVEINGKVYLLRLMQGANISPAVAGGGYNSEWDNLIVKIVNEWKLYNYRSDLSFTHIAMGYLNNHTQEVGNALNNRVMRGTVNTESYGNGVSSSINEGNVWRPVLELLYEV